MGKRDEEQARSKISEFLSRRSDLIKRNKPLREIKQQQGFNLVTYSEQNLLRLRQMLQQTSALLKRTVTEGELQSHELAGYDSLAEPVYLFEEERQLFQLIVSNVTLKHSTVKMDIHDTDKLKSVRAMAHEGKDLNYSRTGAKHGRQAFVYFLTGVGDFPIDTGLESLPVCTISLDQLAVHNRAKYKELYVSPHLAEFAENTGCDPIILDGTRVDIHLTGASEDKKITYRIKRQSGEAFTFELAINELVYYGGDDIRLATAYHVILLLRMVGNPFRARFLQQINSEKLNTDNKLAYISEVTCALLPAARIWEAKAFDDLPLLPEYAMISNVPDKDASEEDFNPYDYKPPIVDEDFLGDISKQIETLQLTNSAEEKPYNQDDVYELFRSILNSIEFVESRVFEGMPVGLSLADRIQCFALKLVISDSEHASDILKWLCQASFSEPGSLVYHCLNVNERERTNRSDLIESLLRSLASSNIEDSCKRLEILLRHASLETVSKRMPYYIAISAHKCFGKPIGDSEVVNFLLKQQVMFDSSSPLLVEWLRFDSNERLLDYLFIEKGIDVNAQINGKTWLEHAIDIAVTRQSSRYDSLSGCNDPFSSVNYLISHGAKLTKPLTSDVLCRLPSSIVKKLNLHVDDKGATTAAAAVKAVVVIVTARNHDDATYVVVGRRANYSTNTLENFWAFPGGLIDEGKLLSKRQEESSKKKQPCA